MSKRILKISEKESKESLAKIINAAGVISKNSLQKILDAFVTVEYDKNQKIIKEGDITEYLYFISKGIVRVYYHKSGKEIIDWFAEEGCFFGNIYSHIKNKPGFDIYESLEDVSLLRIKYSDLEKLYTQSHEIETIARKVMEHYYITYVERAHNLKALPSDEKYHLFVTQYDIFMNRIPLKYVANYLGITSETLSRIRARYDKRLSKVKKGQLN